jgi:hypothetical protein
VIFTVFWFLKVVHDLTLFPFHFSSLAEHGIVVEYFTEIPGLEVAKLTSNPKYPKTPDEVQKLQTFETPQGKGDHYGARLRTYFMVRCEWTS